MDIKREDCEHSDYIKLSQDRIEWLAFFDTLNCESGENVDQINNYQFLKRDHVLRSKFFFS
jgi:hypothetical protein